MELMISQKNQLLELIRIYELEPFNFEWVKIKNRYERLIPVLKYQDTPYYFSIDITRDGFICIH